MHNINPSIKAGTVTIAAIAVAFLFDPVTLLLYAGWTMAVTLLFGKIQIRKYFLYLLPFTIFALGMLVSTLLFAKTPADPSVTQQFLFWNLPSETVQDALALAIRVFSYATLSLLFVLTTDKVAFILSLIQQCRVSPKLAYGILAGYRFLPLLTNELTTIRSAHLVRGARTKTSRLTRYKQYTIPLLASAIRKAERTAVAMESKGFTGEKDRTYYRSYHVRWTDWTFSFVMLCALGLCIVFSKSFQ
ncbi:energy-coupling factor transport system permease protein [Terribacillus aidingensis]|uniref:Energy-coupling factor transport system permease protein n=1 Tax=Terribacillus aidingensis TaxID=586416 RepID=A0A285P296_9BACI|nr:energy-coupling factor transporter transmembrane component T [Terribacillus aidingensis]SNZ14001.1 energy-coupling factor transport system permease protein [Terribacillus aidingensis]